MLRHPVSSSPDHRLAARRLDLGLALMAEGQPEAAAEAFRAAVELAPDYADAYFCLAEAAADCGDREAGLAGYARYLALAPKDVLGAAPRVALLGGTSPEALPPEYVRTLFDQYADGFDAALTSRLGYRAPALLRQAIDRLRPAAGGLAVLDLGCGTGLAGAAVRDLAARLVGVELSPEMAARARARRVYDEVVVGDLKAFLAAAAAASFDLILAADVLTYLGDLGPVVSEAARALRPGGLGFTVERLEGSGYRLGPRQRFAHSVDHILSVVAAAGLTVTVLEEASSRTENRHPVPGLVVILAKP